jgi:hypothetical protein
VGGTKHILAIVCDCPSNGSCNKREATRNPKS